MAKLDIVFAGTPAFAATILDALIASGHRIKAVYTQPDRPAGRGRKPRPSPVKVLAERHGLPVLQPATLKGAEAQETLKGLHPDLMVVAAYGLILPKAVLETPRLGCVNVHASLLPRWRGAAPIQRAIEAGDEETGITLMQMDEGLDTGPILLQASLPILPEDTAGTLHEKLARLGAQTLVKALEPIAERALPPIPQDERLATYAPRIEKKEALLDWKEEAVKLERKVRAFNPWPVAFTYLDGTTLRIFRARATDEHPDEPGSVIHIDREGIGVSAGKGVLRLLEVQRPGGRPLPAGEFVKAFRPFPTHLGNPHG
ncbi:MAG: methionyl-tRNA formyltransferase [Gammaproteobacteria bacterium]|nr:MAG: methionyl-tRNA formyltransferase [Gammaproteobacteria bacterium]